MQALDVIKDPSSIADRSVFALNGDDAYLRREALGSLLKGLLGPEADDLAIARKVGDQARPAEVFDELRTLPFLVKRRVVIVEDADPFVTAYRKELEALVDRPPTPGALVLIVKTWPSNTRLAKSVAKVGASIECNTPREGDLPAWLGHYARTHSRSKLGPEAARLLLELVGADLGVLASEVEKLATYVGDGREISVEDVARMVGAGRIDTVWNVLDAALSGRNDRALLDLDRLVSSGEHPVGLLAAMGFSLRKLHHAGQLRRNGIGLEQACEEAGIYRSGARRAADQHQHLGPNRVDSIPAALLKADFHLKGGSNLPTEVVLERFIVELGRPRTD